jgi:GNAT superfamily N-acetyltransferase
VRVGYAQARPGQAAALVARVVQYARGKQLQVQWSVVPERSGEEDLAAALKEAGFTRTEDLLLMAHAGPIEATGDTRVTIQPIMRWQTMLEYEYGSRQCFYDDPAPLEGWVQQRATDRWREQQNGWYRYYAALLDGRLVGGCYISLFEDIPTLMGVYTLPEVRKRGVATRMIAETVNQMVRPDHDICCLFVERANPARNLYTDLGFVPIISTMTFTLGLR